MALRIGSAEHAKPAVPRKKEAGKSGLFLFQSCIAGISFGSGFSA